MLTALQYRISKGVLNPKANIIASYLDLHPVSFVKFEHLKNFEYLNGLKRNQILIRKFFEAYGVVFPDEKTVSLNKKQIVLNNNINSLTRFHFKASRIACNLTQSQLGSLINVPERTLSDFESFNNEDYIKSRVIDPKRIRVFFENLGIEFIDDLTISIKCEIKNFFN